MLESINPWVYSLQFLFKSTNNSWRYERKCDWVFFSEHSVQCTFKQWQATARQQQAIYQRSSYRQPFYIHRPANKHRVITSWHQLVRRVAQQNTANSVSATGTNTSVVTVVNTTTQLRDVW